MIRILRGECGAFNPMLINCPLDVRDKIQMEFNTMTFQPVYHLTEALRSRDVLP